MTQTIPSKAIEAAATALANSIGHGMTEKCVEHAKHALAAALPHLSASDDGVAVKADTVHRFAQEYEHREPDLTPTDIERMMIEDAINGFLSEHALTPANLPGTTGGVDAVRKAAAEEYELTHPSENEDERRGRRNAIRGMLARLGLYGHVGLPQATDEAAKGGVEPVGALPFSIQAGIDGALYAVFASSTEAEAHRSTFAGLDVANFDGFENAYRISPATLAPSEATSGDVIDALRQAEACMSIVEPRSDKAEYLRILGVVRTALASLDQPKGSADVWISEYALRCLISEGEGTYQVRGTKHRRPDDVPLAALSHSAASTHSPTKTDGEFERVLEEALAIKVPCHLDDFSAGRALGIMNQQRNALRRLRTLLPADKKEGE